MLLCAGLGTRLRPLTDERPKPLVPVHGRPLASWALERLAAAGVRHVVANGFHLAAQLAPALDPFAARLGLSLQVRVEPRLLGTGGGIRNALDALGDGDFVVFNGDVLAAPDLAAALALHRARGALMTMVLREDPRAAALGAIEVTGEGRVVRILDEGPVHPAPTRRCLFTGVYVLHHAIAGELPVEGCVVRHTLRRLLARGAPVAGIVDAGPWYDLGTPASYAAAQFALLRGEVALPGLPPAPGARRICEGARIGAEVALGPEVCVGPDAVVEGRGELRRAIVWDGAVAQAPCHDVVVTPARVLSIAPGAGAALPGAPVRS